MDVSLSNNILQTANAMSRSKRVDAVQTQVSKKSMDVQENAAATLLQALPQPQQLAALWRAGHQGQHLCLKLAASTSNGPPLAGFFCG